jgi:hypothetical protein
MRPYAVSNISLTDIYDTPRIAGVPYDVHATGFNAREIDVAQRQPTALRVSYPM